MVRSAAAAALLELIRSRRAKTGVIGLGYVGLPLAVEFGRAGLLRHRHRPRRAKVNAINEGRSYIDDVPTAHVAELKAAEPPDGHDQLRRARASSTRSTSACRRRCARRRTRTCPTSSRRPRRSRSASGPGSWSSWSRRPIPGTTDELVLPMLEKSGLKVGKDFFLAFSPERVDPANPHVQHPQHPEGRRRHDARTARRWPPRSTTARSRPIVPVSSPRVAEMVKLLENTFRAVNIGMVNELALMCDRMGIDVWEVVKAAATKPFGFMPFYPGPGLGGHCIPVDPFYLSWKARAVGLRGALHRAGGRRQRQRCRTTSCRSSRRAERACACRSTAPRCWWRASPTSATSTTSANRRRSICCTCCRSAAPSWPTPIRSCPTLSGTVWPNGIDLVHVDVAQAAPGEYDCVVVVTDHTAFNYEHLQRAAKVVVDTRNAIKSPGAHVVRLGRGAPQSASPSSHPRTEQSAALSCRPWRVTPGRLPSPSAN